MGLLQNILIGIYLLAGLVGSLYIAFSIGSGVNSFFVGLIVFVGAMVFTFWAYFKFVYFWIEDFISSEEGRIANRIERRKSQARDRNIVSKALLVLEYLGDRRGFQDGVLSIKTTDANGVVIEIPGAKQPEVVFDSGTYNDGYWSGPVQTHIKPTSDGGYVAETRSDSGYGSPQWSIKLYIPGVWEQHLTTLYDVALNKQMQRAQEAAAARKKDTQDTKDKWKV